MYSLNLNNIQKRSHLLFTFMALAKRYLNFKVVEMTKNGTPKRKDRCADYFPVGEADIPVYKPVMPTINKDVARGTKMIINYLQMISDSATDEELPYNVRQAMGTTLTWLGNYYQLKQVENKGQTLLHWQDVLFKKQNKFSLLSQLSSRLTQKINEYDEGKIKEDLLKIISIIFMISLLMSCKTQQSSRQKTTVVATDTTAITQVAAQDSASIITRVTQ